MALGLSFSLSSIPGLSGLLSQLDQARNNFLAVPAQVTASLSRLALVRQAMVTNAAPPSAQSDALQVEQHLHQVQDEWNVAAQALQHLDSARQTGGITLDLLSSAGQLVTSVAYVVSNERTLTASVDALAAKYLTPQQVQAVNASVGSFGGGSVPWVPLLLLGAAAYYAFG